MTVTAEEIEDTKVKAALLRAARDAKAMMATPGWQQVYAILSERPTALAHEAMTDASAEAKYWKGRYEESRFLLKEIDLLLEAGKALLQEAESAQATQLEMRQVLGGGAGDLT